jgi:predicted aspartyl protease
VIYGFVNPRREAVVSLRLRGPGLAELDADAVVDTGFTASLTLPISMIVALGLVRQSAGTALMADGSVSYFDIYAAEVAWQGGWRNVMVSAVGTETLIGMKLLAGSELRIEVVSGGLVEISQLP